MNHWIRPSCDSRTGASHLRRAVPCQDSSGLLGFRDAAGMPIQVLVVSDGHGGSRYVRSDVGARLACAVAMRELQQALAPARVAHPGAVEEWRGWLADELPARIASAWLREVESHWRAEPGADGSGFSPVLYGATLGVVLLTPAWWAHTGIGDWDLVRVEAAGGEALLSEEPEREAAGEATFSLCMERAGRYFAPRTALEPLTPETPPFALLLSSDGLRKSCGSDSDFLTLCRYLVGLSPSGDQSGSAELAEALDHISRQGSGDDISIAVARWAPVSQGPAWPDARGKRPVRLLRPAPAGASGSPPPAAVTGGSPAPRQLEDAAVPEQGRPGSPRTAAGSIGAPSGMADAVALDPRSAPGRSSRLKRSRLSRPVWAALLAVLGLGGVALIAHGLGLGPLAARRQSSPLALTPQQHDDLQRQVDLLCHPAAASAAEHNRGDETEPARGSISGGSPSRGSIPAADGARLPSLQGAGQIAPRSRPELPRPGRAAVLPTPTGAGTPTVSETAVSETAVPGTVVVETGGAETGVAGTAASISSPDGAVGSSQAAAGRSPGTALVDPQRMQRIAATLAARASTFQRLESGDPTLVQAKLRLSPVDPLSALIAYSSTDASLRGPATAVEPGWWQSLAQRFADLLPIPSGSGSNAALPPSPLAALGACPELTMALRLSWQRQAASGAAAMSAAPAAAPRDGAAPMPGLQAPADAPGGGAAPERGLRPAGRLPAPGAPGAAPLERSASPSR